MMHGPINIRFNFSLSILRPAVCGMGINESHLPKTAKNQRNAVEKYVV